MAPGSAIDRVVDYANATCDGAILFVRSRHTQRDVRFPIGDAEIARVDVELELQSRIRAQELRQVGNQNIVQHQRHRRDPHFADCHAIRAGHAISDGINIEFDALGAANDDPPAICRAKNTGIAFEETHPQ